jgi:hypothetical protein
LAQNIGEQTGAEKVLRAEVRQRRAEPHAERGGTLAIVGSLVSYLRKRSTYEGICHVEWIDGFFPGQTPFLLRRERCHSGAGIIHGLVIGNYA